MIAAIEISSTSPSGSLAVICRVAVSPAATEMRGPHVTAGRPAALGQGELELALLRGTAGVLTVKLALLLSVSWQPFSLRFAALTAPLDVAGRRRLRLLPGAGAVAEPVVHGRAREQVDAAGVGPHRAVADRVGRRQVGGATPTGGHLDQVVLAGLQRAGELDGVAALAPAGGGEVAHLEVAHRDRRVAAVEQLDEVVLERRAAVPTTAIHLRDDEIRRRRARGRGEPGRRERRRGDQRCDTCNDPRHGASPEPCPAPAAGLDKGARLLPSAERRSEACPNGYRRSGQRLAFRRWRRSASTRSTPAG